LGDITISDFKRLRQPRVEVVIDRQAGPRRDAGLSTDKPAAKR
jgi:hypothetical protein